MHFRRTTTPMVLALALSILLAGCDSGFPASNSSATISEDAFVDAMVELRRAAVEEEDLRIRPNRRDEILQARGLAVEDLTGFVEVHGADVPRMNRVWTRIEARLTGQDPEDFEFDAEDFDTIPGLEPDPLNPDEPPTDALPGGDGPPLPPRPGAGGDGPR